MRVGLALLLGLCGCRSDVLTDGPQPDGGGGGDQAGQDGGSLDGPKISLARACRGYMAPSPTARLCRTSADCANQYEDCLSPGYRPPMPSGIGARIVQDAAKVGIFARRVGKAGGDALKLPGEAPLSLASLRSAYERWLPAFMGGS